MTFSRKWENSYFPLPNAIDGTLTKGEKHGCEDDIIFTSYFLRIGLANCRNCFQKKENYLSETKLTVPKLGMPDSSVR